MSDKPKLLIVDDVSENIHILSNILKDDFKIIAATSGKKALELAQKTPKPDLIVLDIIMPEMDGYEVCKQLKQNKSTKNIPVVFITSLNDAQDIEKGFECGASEFITKPILNTLVKRRLLNQITIENYNMQKTIVKNKEVIMKDNEKETILVVDDSPENIKVILEILKDSYRLIVANNGERALEILNEKSPDLILLDILMPDMDGFEVCKIIQNDDRINKIPIMFLTVLEDKKDVVKGLMLGAVDYVSKPVEPTVLKERIKTHLKLKHFQDKLLKDIQEKDDILLKQSKFAVLGEMFENITHQWKQPLSIVNMSSANIRMQKEFGELDDKILYSTLTDIESSINHLNQTINDFRDFLQDDVKKQYFCIKDVIEKTLKLLDSKFTNRNITIENNVENIEVSSVKNDLIQVLMNIFSNAENILENKVGKRIIKIESILEEDIVIIKINDNGGGIKDEVIDTMFKKYITTKSEKKGTGIGLYMTKKLIEERLNGNIKSYNENDGACFEIVSL